MACKHNHTVDTTTMATSQSGRTYVKCLMCTTICELGEFTLKIFDRHGKPLTLNVPCSASVNLKAKSATRNQERIRSVRNAEKMQLSMH